MFTKLLIIYAVLCTILQTFQFLRAPIDLTEQFAKPVTQPAPFKIEIK